jgi:hypothetical protein
MVIYKKNNSVSDRLKQIKIPAVLQKVEAAPTSAMKRLIKRFAKIIFFFQKAQEAPLQGRIHELKSQSDEFYRHLVEIKKQFSGKVGLEVYTFVEAIIDPLLREFNAIQTQLHEGNKAQPLSALGTAASPRFRGTRISRCCCEAFDRGGLKSSRSRYTSH